jgi:hypothetical protein
VHRAPWCRRRWLAGQAVRRDEVRSRKPATRWRRSGLVVPTRQRGFGTIGTGSRRLSRSPRSRPRRNRLGGLDQRQHSPAERLRQGRPSIKDAGQARVGDSGCAGFCAATQTMCGFPSEFLVGSNPALVAVPSGRTEQAGPAAGHPAGGGWKTARRTILYGRPPRFPGPSGRGRINSRRWPAAIELPSAVSPGRPAGGRGPQPGPRHRLRYARAGRRAHRLPARGPAAAALTRPALGTGVPPRPGCFAGGRGGPARPGREAVDPHLAPHSAEPRPARLAPRRAARTGARGGWGGHRACVSGSAAAGGAGAMPSRAAAVTRAGELPTPLAPPAPARPLPVARPATAGAVSLPQPSPLPGRAGRPRRPHGRPARRPRRPRPRRGLRNRRSRPSRPPASLGHRTILYARRRPLAPGAVCLLSSVVCPLLHPPPGSEITTRRARRHPHPAPRRCQVFSRRHCPDRWTHGGRR